MKNKHLGLLASILIFCYYPVEASTTAQPASQLETAAPSAASQSETAAQAPATTPVAANPASEAIAEPLSLGSPADLVEPTVDEASKAALQEEIQRIQKEQLRMIMRLNKAEDIRNAEIRQRHENFIKQFPELAQSSKPEAVKSKKSFWSRFVFW